MFRFISYALGDAMLESLQILVHIPLLLQNHDRNSFHQVRREKEE
jgi:hypothetical protein